MSSCFLLFPVPPLSPPPGQHTHFCFVAQLSISSLGRLPWAASLSMRSHSCGPHFAWRHCLVCHTLTCCPPGDYEEQEGSVFLTLEFQRIAQGLAQCRFWIFVWLLADQGTLTSAAKRTPCRLDSAPLPFSVQTEHPGEVIHSRGLTNVKRGRIPTPLWPLSFPLALVPGDTTFSRHF